MVEFKFHLKMPIFVARQHLRHRMASVNEMSARYSVVPDEFFTPQGYRRQSTVNKQSSDGRIENSDELGRTIKTKTTEMFQMYTDALGQGCCRELARCHLPQSTYTEFYWKINLHNLMHYLQLRMEPGAQEEIRDYAYAIYSLVQPLAPVTMRAFQDFRLGSMTLTRQEIILLRPTVTEEDVQRSELSPGEKREFLNKLKTLRFL
jgi:thymidylate synthase (FAD)